MMKNMMKRVIQRSETGQSIVLLAFGFIALVAFVGITTDVSLMFVRYATLRRAVDSASIAAATQLRQGSDYASVRLAAQQFIDFHGMENYNVEVNTCQSVDTAHEDYSELCTEDQRKLVKVYARGRMPTVFLKLIGWDSFPLDVTAISETAALDVVLMMDVSESMLQETTYEDWARIGQGYVYVPPRVEDIINTEIGNGEFVANNPSLPPADEYWQEELLSIPQIEVNNRLWYSGAVGESPPATHAAYQVDSILPARFTDTAQGFPATHTAQREACRVRFAPISTRFRPSSQGGRVLDPTESLTTFWTNNGETAPTVLNLHHEDPLGVERGFYSEIGASYTQTNWNGFVPTFDFYGCCNDPTVGGRFDPDTGAWDGSGVTATEGSVSGAGDFDFSDLICQPFKGARDATLTILGPYRLHSWGSCRLCHV